MKTNRIENVLNYMKKDCIDTLVISDPSSIDYLIQYKNNPGERLYALILNQNGQHVLLLNHLFYLDQKLDIKVEWYNDVDNPYHILRPYMEQSQVIGVDKFFVAQFLIPLMTEFKQAQFVVGSKCVDYVRMIKDEEEQNAMIQASLYNDEVIAEVMNLCAEGMMSEKDISSQLSQMYIDRGGEGISFTPIVAFGKNGADTHHEGDDSLLNEGDSIIIDIGGKYKGYCSDMTRTVFYKSASHKQIEVYNLVLKANEAAIQMIKPGVKLCDIDAAARTIISDAGYGKEFNHRLGHFIGRDVHEYGDVSSKFDMEVQEGMVFSIEPGIYLQGEFGVRIEDLVLVTKDGCHVLNHMSKELKII